MASTFYLQEQLCPNLSLDNSHTYERKKSNEKNKLPQRIRPSAHKDTIPLEILKESTHQSRGTITPVIPENSFEDGSENSGSSSAGTRPLRSIPQIQIPKPFVSDCLAASSDPNGPEREFFMRCIVMGANNTGKRSLVDAIFSGPQTEGHKDRSSVDLVIRTVVNHNNTKKYHFWMRNLENESRVKENLWKTYYNWATAFVFVYDTTNRESFEAAEQAVKKVQEVVPKEKFFGILVGTKPDLQEQRSVDYNEGKELSERHQFSYFIETTPSIEKNVPQLLPRLDTKMKLTFEAI